MPLILKTKRISWVAYALDDKASDAKTGSATLLGKRVSPNLSLLSARPTSKRFIEVVIMATIPHITQQIDSTPLTTPVTEIDSPVTYVLTANHSKD